MPAFSEDDEKNSAAGPSSQNKEKVKTRNTTTSTVTTTSTQQHHSSINMANIATANTNITTVPITADSASLASQGINVCRRLIVSLFESIIDSERNNHNHYSLLVEFFFLIFSLRFISFLTTFLDSF